MLVTIKIKSSLVPSSVPTSLVRGELALNAADGRLYYNNAQGVVTPFLKGAPNGGTTGQVLVKASTADGDYTWQNVPPGQVLAAALEGLNTSTTAIITEADTVISGFGKLQAQTSSLQSQIAAKAPTTAPTIVSLREQAVALGGTSNIDMLLGNAFKKTITANTTLTVSNVPANGMMYAGILELTNGGAGVITFPTGSKFVSGLKPTLSVSGVDVLGFYTNDGGVTINWFTIGIKVS